MRAQLAALGAFAGDAFVVVVNDGLKQRAEDGGADLRPVKALGAVKQYVASAAVKVANRELAVEHAAVDVRKVLQLGRQVFGALGARAVEGVKQVLQRAVQVGAVFAAVLAQVAAKVAPALKDAGVFGKQAKHQAHQVALKVGAGIAAAAHGVVQLGNFAGGAFVDGDLLGLRLRLEAGQKQVVVNVQAEVVQLVAQRWVAGAVVVEVQVLEVADQDVVRQFGVFQAGQVVSGLLVGFFKVFAA